LRKRQFLQSDATDAAPHVSGFVGEFLDENGQRINCSGTICRVKYRTPGKYYPVYSVYDGNCENSCESKQDKFEVNVTQNTTGLSKVATNLDKQTKHRIATAKRNSRSMDQLSQIA